MLSADVRRGVRFDAPASRAFDGTCGDVPSHTPPRWLSQHLLPNRDAALCCVNVYVHSLCRAAGVLESQESGGRARPSCSQRCRRQAEFEALGSGDAMVATSRAPTPTWLGLALLLLDAASAPLLSACAALQYRRCSPAASATRRLDQVPVEPGTSATSFTTVAGAYTRLFLSGAGRSPPKLFRRGRASTRQGLFPSFVRGQNDFQAGSVLRTQGDRCSCKHALAAEGRRGLSLLVDVLAGVFRLPELLPGASGYRGP